MSSFLRTFLLTALLALPTWATSAQRVDLRVLEERPDGATLELVAQWPRTLRAALDSLGASEMDERVARASVNGLFSVSETLRLPSLASPRVRIVSADYDEVMLPAAPDQDDLLAELDGAPAEALGLGIERKRPAVTLAARLLTYDRAGGVLRRYRRLTIAIDYRRGPAARTTALQPLGGPSSNPHLAVERSVLADGIVYKIAVTQEGLYRIDRAFLQNLPGLERSPDSIDPHTVKVFGNGGKPLPARNGDPRPADLIENPVFVRGGGDGAFNQGDAVVFYAAAPTGWEATIDRDFRGDPVLDVEGNVVRRWRHYVHPFSSENYYFIKIDDAPNTRLEPQTYPGFTDATVLSQIVGRHVVDFDDFLWARENGGTGHTYVSNLIALGGGRLDLIQNLAVPGLTDGTVNYRARAAVQSNPAASVFFRTGSQQLASVNFGAVSNSATVTVARSGEVDFSQPISAGATLSLTMELENQIGSPKAAIDWLRIFYPKALRATADRLRFHTPLGATGRFEFVLTDFSAEPQVWDVTEPSAIRRLGVQAGGGVYRVQVDVADPDQPRELMAFSDNAVRSLNTDEACLGAQGCRVAPQNLHGIASFPDFVIFTPSVFRPFAEELADRRRQEGLVVEVVDVAHIYNEFGGGLADARAVRDYLKFLYDRAPDEENLLRYALLFGDGHYNYRSLGEEPELENWVLPFETEESFDPESSYTSDDYFGLLDDDEGRWIYTRRNWSGNNEDLNERVDIGIGRFTVQTTEEAETLLHKIERYENPETFQPWRLRYVFLADDALTGINGQQDDQDLHTQNTDVVAERVRQVAPEINQQKIYGISYPREFLNGWRLPEARQDILQALQDGALVFNYSGHGGEEGLAQEELFTREDARSVQNGDRLPIFITATCSFGRWDLDDEQSGAEELLLNPSGGAVALMTTVRTVYTTGGITTLNVGLNYELNRQLFLRDADGLPRRLGDALRETKNARVGYEGNNRKFNLLGDPTMRLGLPAYRAVVETINGATVGETPLPLRALERMTIEGGIQTPDGLPAADFDGAVNLTVFDAQRRVTLPVQFYMDQPYYTVREDLIWRGTVDARGGRFSATFVVPKDISYSNQPGRISVYAASAVSQAQGFTESLVVGGTAPDAQDDGKGPEIDLFLNDETFVEGGLVQPRPRLIVRLFDESGINTVGAGVGHEMLLVVDGDEPNAVDVGGLYQSEENSFQRGRVEFNFAEDFAPGQHTLSVRAWDVFNNSGTATLDFTVTEETALVVRNVFNYPNPTPGETRFVFEHNQPPGTPVRVQVRIYTLAGRPIRTIEREDLLPGGPMQVNWDGLDDDFDRLATGLYLYKVRVEVDGADGGRQVSEQIEKLAVIR